MKLIFKEDGHPAAQADPFVFSHGPYYYIYTTGVTGVYGYRAERLDGEWTCLGVVYSREGRRKYWAPCVLAADGVCYLYVSTAEADSENDHAEGIEVAVSDGPEGPFRFVRTLLPPFSIDPHVVKSGDDLYMFYSVNDYESERIGTYIVVQKMGSPTETEGEPVPVLRPTLDEEIFCRNRFRDGRDWYTLEGACYFREGDDHYLMYSGNCYLNETYYLGYATAHSAEDDLTKVHFEKFPAADVYEPLIAKNEAESGTGHNSVIKVDGDYWCVYHGRDADAPADGDSRSARMCRLLVKDGRLTAVR